MNGKFNLIVVKDYDEMSYEAFQYIKNEIANGANNLGMATGSTPIGLYNYIVDDYQSFKNYESLNYYNLDEYHGLSSEHSQSYSYFMKEMLFSKINAKNTFIPDGSLEISEAVSTYQNILDDVNIDVQILGIGRNGHIGFNEPGTPFEINTNFVKLKNSTREANKRFFDNEINNVPEYAITMGIADIMKSKKILLLANGESKAKAIYDMMYGEKSTLCPASILQDHADVTVIIDKNAASKLPLNVMGVDISSTRIKVGIFNGNYERLNFEVIDHNFEDIYGKTLKLINKYLNDDIYKIGVSVSGYVHNGVVSHPRINFDKFNMIEALSKDINRNCCLHVVNRANASALGEFQLKFSDHYSLYYISLATGIGGGYIVDGKVVNGKNGFAGEISNMIIDTHEFNDDFYANGSIEMHYDMYKVTKNEKLFVKQIGTVIANIVNSVDPDVIVLDIKNLDLDETLRSKIEDHVNHLVYDKFDEKIKLESSSVEDESLIGAAMYAFSL